MVDSGLKLKGCGISMADSPTILWLRLNGLPYRELTNSYDREWEDSQYRERFRDNWFCGLRMDSWDFAPYCDECQRRHGFVW